MKPLTFSLLRDFVEFYKDVVIGSLLMGVGRYEKNLWLFFYKEETPFYLYLYMSPGSPLPLLFKQKLPPFPLSKGEKPVQLFLKKHVLKSRVTCFFVNANKGRILFLKLQNKSRQSALEIRLFPHGQNIIVQSDDKRISWNKVMEPPPFHPVQEQKQAQEAAKAAFVDFDEVSQRFLKEQSERKKKGIEQDKRNKGKQENSEIQFKHLIQKKQKILEKILLNLKEKEQKTQKYLKLGHYLNGVLRLEEVDLKWEKDIDYAKSLSWNRDRIFALYKKEKQKCHTMLKRISVLKEEIENLYKSPDSHVKKENFKRDYLDTRKRKETYLILTDKVMAFMGTSAQENLRLLRRSKPWHLWLHAKDMPGPHILVECLRGYKLREEDLLKAVKWLYGFQFKKNLPPVEFCVIVAECRYVRPIKGDKLGRVSYQNHRTFIYKENG